MTRSLGRALGPAITLLAIAGLAGLSATEFKIPNPPAVLVLAVVFSAFVGGLGPGLISAAVAWAYVASFFSIPGQLFAYEPENYLRVSLWAVSLPWAAVMVGLLEARARRAVEDEQTSVVQRERQKAQQAEHAMLAHEVRFQAMIEHSADAITLLAADGGIVYTSPAVTRLLGIQAAALLGQNVLGLVHPDDRSLVADLIARLLSQPREVVLGRLRYQHRDGAWHWAEATGTNLLAEPSVQAIVVNYHDITESVQAEERLRRSEEHFRALIENSSDIITLLDGQGKIRYESPSVERVLGYRPADLMGRNVFEYIHPDDVPTVTEAIQRALAEPGPSTTVDFRYRHADGSWRILEATGKQSIDEAGQIVGIINSRDVSERKRRERELEAIAAVSASLRTAPSRAEMLALILDQLLNLMAADGTALVTRDPASGEIVVELGAGGLAGTTGARLGAGQGITGQVIASGQPYVTDDVQADPRLVPGELPAGLRAAVCVPLFAREQVIGALWAVRQAEMNGSELRVVQAIGDLAANALHRAALHEQTERQVQKLAALRSIDLVISSSFDLRLTLKMLLDQVVTQLRVDAADVLLFNPRTQALVYADGWGFYSDSIKQFQTRLGVGYAGQAVLERQTVSILDLRAPDTGFLRAPLAAAEGFVAYHGVPLLAKGEVKGVLEVFHRTPFSPDREWRDFLEILGGQLAIALDSAELFEDLQRSNFELALAYDATIEGWSRALDLRDKETEGHTQRVMEMTLDLARAMNLGDEELVHIRRGALLHDIGKMGIPDVILHKPGPLTEAEWAIMRRHPVYAHEMLSPIAYLRPALDIPYCHHERWDGQGYPRGLVGDTIPLAARIFAVADVWDALRSNRPYRAAWPEAQVLAHIREQSGKQFDPQIVTALLRLVGLEA